MKTAKAITGANLLHYKDKLDLYEEFIARIDPDGINIIVTAVIYVDHLQTHDTLIRLRMLFKLLNREEPYEKHVTMPFSIFNVIVETVGATYVN